MYLYRSVLIVTISICGLAGGASAALFDDFDSYAYQAAFEAAWPPWSIDGSSMSLLQSFGHSDSQSVSGRAPAGGMCRNHRNLDSFTLYTGTDDAPVLFSVWVYETNPELNTVRSYVELRAYEGDGLPASGSTTGLQGIVALGFYNLPDAPSDFKGRVVGGGVSSWYALDTDVSRGPGWHHLMALIGGSWVKFYVDGMAGTVVSLPSGPIPAFDGVVLGSALTSGGDVAFDDIRVEKLPEPATLLMLACGPLLLRRRRICQEWPRLPAT